MNDLGEWGEKAGRLILLSRMRMEGKTRGLSDIASLMTLYVSSAEFRTLAKAVAKGLGFELLGYGRESGLALMPREKGPFCGNLELDIKGGKSSEESKAKFRRRIFFLTVFIASLFCGEGGDVIMGKRLAPEAIVNGLKTRIRALASQDGDLAADSLAREFMDLPTGDMGGGEGDDGIELSTGYSSKTLFGLVDICLKKMEDAGYLAHDQANGEWLPTAVFPYVAEHVWKNVGHLIVMEDD